MHTPFFVGRKVSFKNIREKENFQDCKHYEKLEQNDAPHFPSPGHAFKPLEIEPEYPFYHNSQNWRPKIKNLIRYHRGLAYFYLL
jgi:hypothetical protein